MRTTQEILRDIDDTLKELERVIIQESWKKEDSQAWAITQEAIQILKESQRVITKQ